MSGTVYLILLTYSLFPVSSFYFSVVYCSHMDLASSQAFFWLAFGVALFGVAAFICWVLFEVARMIRQGNEVVEHTREIVGGIEEDIAHVKEKLGGVLGSLAGVAAATKGLASLANKVKSKKSKRSRVEEDEK